MSLECEKNAETEFHLLVADLRLQSVGSCFVLGRFFRQRLNLVLMKLLHSLALFS